MGKYMRKAKTLALQRLQSSSSCYLQLRSRRLQKLSVLRLRSRKPISIPPKESCGPQPQQLKPSPSGSNSRLIVSLSVLSGSVEPAPIIRTHQHEGCFSECRDLGVEPSFGENDLDFEPRERERRRKRRSTRESTPCSFIRDVDLATSGSSTRQKTVNITNRSSQNAIVENVPSAAEIEEFFAQADEKQQRQFIEKYNFDIVNDMPLHGRYEWVRLND